MEFFKILRNIIKLQTMTGQYKLVILSLILISAMGCRILKENVAPEIDYSLINRILSEFEKEDFNCLNPKSTSFSFEFPDSFDKYDTRTLSEKEKSLIEQAFGQNTVLWDFTKIKIFGSGSRKGCVNLSKPIVFRNDTLAFIYISDGSGEFYNLYEKHDSGWQLFENLITTFY